MYTMKNVCEQAGISYEALRFYCNEGLVPNITRDKNNYRIFGEKDIAWLKSLLCLKKCGLSIKGMKHYMHLCLEGPSTIAERKRLLAIQEKILLKKSEEIHTCLEFIADKQSFYDSVLAGETTYSSNLIPDK